MRRLKNYFALALLLSLIAGNALPQPARADFTDGTGVEVAFGLDAQRIVCLAPNLTEMLWFIGLGERQVGRSGFCDYPPEAEAVRSVGGFADTSLELVVSLNPDLVVAYQGNSLELVSQLRKLGITVLAFEEARSLAEIGAQMDVLWKVASTTGASTPAPLTKWKARLTKLNRQCAKPLRIFYGYPGEMGFTCGRSSFLSDLITRAGGVNVANGESRRWPQVSAEFILASQPDVLLTASSCSGEETLADARRRLLDEMSRGKVWGELPAVKKGQVIVMDSGVLLRPGPRVLDALEDLGKALAGWE